MFRARGCSNEEAADFAQEAAVRAYVHIRRWGAAGAGLDPLLNRIARNLLIDKYRRGVPYLVPLESAHELHDPRQDPTEEVARRQRRRAVHSAIRSLPDRHQRAITYSMSGMTPEEVGERMGIGRNAADALLHRARRSLKERLEPVRDGAWGIALGVRVRWDRVARRVGLRPGIDASGTTAAWQSGLGVAAAALVTALAVAGGGGATASSRAPGRPVLAPPGAAVGGGAGAAAGGAFLAGPAAEGSGSSVSRTYRLGPAAHTFGPGGSTTHAGVPAPPRDGRGREILGADVELSNSDEPQPMDRRWERLSTGVCETAPALCWPAGGD